MAASSLAKIGRGRAKFFIGGGLILAAVLYLIVSASLANAQYFLTVNELAARGTQAVGQNVRISGAVIGDTIQYDKKTLLLKFTIAHVAGSNKEIDQQGGLAAALHAAVIDPTRTRLDIEYTGAVPDLLKDEAQAILTGHLRADGVFQADDIQLKCPTKYEEALPTQAAK